MNRILKVLKNTILWKKISFSAAYRKIRFPKGYNRGEKDYHFYKQLLGTNNDLIFDIGANVGEKAAVFKRLAKKVACFEPSPNSLKILKSRFAFSNVSIFPVAISNTRSTSLLYVVKGRETFNSVSNKQLRSVIQPLVNPDNISTINVQTETLDNIIQQLGLPQYIKIDVEGNEKEVITGLSKPVKFLSFENSTPNFLMEGIACIDHLHQISGGTALFNIYNGEKFLFPEFSNADSIKDHFTNHHYDAAEIYCYTV